MENSPFRKPEPDRLAILAIVAKYAVAGALWIYFSDTLLGFFVQDHDLLTRIGTYKGLAFILFTALLLYFLISRYAAKERQARTELLESEARFREITDLLPQTLYEADLKGNLTFTNKAGFAAFGYDAEDYRRGLNIISTMAPSDRERVAANMARLARGEPSIPTDYRAVRKNGETFPVIIYSSVILKDGRPTGFRGVVVDISQYKQMEIKLQQSQKMEAIGTLAGGIAHDFNNILSAIIGYSELINARVHDPETKEQLAAVLQASARASELVRQILTFSRQGQQTVGPLGLRPIIGEAVKLLRATTPSTIRFETRLNTDAQVLADPGEIHRITINLCTNAVKAMENTADGVLTISLTDETVTEAEAQLEPDLQPGPYARLEVSDNGVGMTEEVQARIFEPFYTTRREGEGTGMGLAVVHGIVKARGGTINVRSAPGKGTTMIIRLPQLVHRQPLPIVEPPEAPHGSARLMIVDDERIVAEVLSQIIRNLGYTVTTFTESPKALEHFAGAPNDFDLIITDLTMPRLTGDNFARKVREIRPDVPIIIATGYGDDLTPQELADLKHTSILLKPMQTAEVANAIKHSLEEVAGSVPT